MAVGQASGGCSSRPGRRCRPGLPPPSAVGAVPGIPAVTRGSGVTDDSCPWSPATTAMWHRPGPMRDTSTSSRPGSTRFGPVRSAARPEPKVRPGQRPSCVPRVPPSAEGGTAPGDGRGPAGPMRQLRSSRAAGRGVPQPPGALTPEEPHLCRLACLERRVSWLSRWLLVSSGWRTRPVAAGRRWRREPAAIRSSAPATSRTRRGCGAGRRCRCPGCPHHRDHRRSARTMITIITMRTTVPMPIYIDCSFSRGTRCR